MLGAGFGAATSLINDLSSPYGELGGRLVRTRWTWVTEVAEVGSLLLDVGWAWAAVAVAAGWLAGAIGRAAAAGAVSLMAATAAYYFMDSLLREESLVGYVGETRYWWLDARTVSWRRGREPRPLRSDRPSRRADRARRRARSDAWESAKVRPVSAIAHPWPKRSNSVKPRPR